jgi:opacity protein-like surface antigen
MKYLILSILVLSVTYSTAQKKLTYELTLNGGIGFSRTPPIIEKGYGTAMYNPGTGTITVIPGNDRIANTYKGMAQPQFSLGARVNYDLHKNLKLYGGLTVSFLKVKRENTMPMDFGFPNNPYMIGYYITTETFNFYTLDIPIGANYTINKWSLDLGLIPSINLSSKLVKVEKDMFAEIYPYYDPLMPAHSPQNRIGSFISASILPAYQVSNKIKVGIEYKHGLTDSYATDTYSSEVYQKMKTSTLGLKILYKIK